MNPPPGDKPVQTRRILLVDDEPDFTSMLKEYLLRYRPGAWEVHTAVNYNEALSCLKKHSIEIVTLDLQMPVMDGLQFLTLLKRSYPGLHVVVLTGFVTAENRAFCLQNGAALFLDKLEIAGNFEKVHPALESVAATPTEGFRGMLRQVGLPEVLQMECLGRKSSILEITAPTASGRIFIEDGSIIHAETKSSQGEPALFQLLGLSGGEFRLKPYAKPPRLTIDGHWESLLMEAVRLSDEAAARAPVEAPAEAEDTAALPVIEAPQQLVPEEAPAQAERFLEETVLCSAGGEVLYEWQAVAVNKRVRLLQLLSDKSASLGDTLRLGPADRLEIENNENRVIALLHPERKVFVRVGVRWT